MTRILYEQAHPIEGEELECDNAELFVFRMEKAFSGLPVELDKRHLERLEGMAAMDLPTGPYVKLIRAIKRLGSVKIWMDHGTAD